ncbi:hypothetical protein A3D70_02605 [Candidatus Adlerbacteria bacterium RIFCSPHIGHO2_02_FULL_54_18]|uniref:Ada DNA repair metal-binding domain-containing protein n=1 Tax=Candidatus Adlerbacteria bacterium RIFCSPHIGHO2_02_FULL_54_18 TaxID=1797241 RepID=A0A1F4Y2P7_9BACT|nr:MAG: hypothetical protein A3D70_02605 [Candidatus Adlerbacteria bacterium RIFCSPHIGHO2_02_FULL_54_18]
MPRILTNKDTLRKVELYILPIVLVLVGLGAFGLGRLSVAGEERPRLIINNAPSTQTAAAAAFPKGQGAYVASKSGTKYYLPSCSAATRIKEENKVWFDSIEEAQAVGYEPAANCPGL